MRLARREVSAAARSRTSRSAALGPAGEVRDAVGVGGQPEGLADAVGDRLDDELLLGVGELRRELVERDQGVADLVDPGGEPAVGLQAVGDLDQLLVAVVDCPRPWPVSAMRIR